MCFQNGRETVGKFPRLWVQEGQTGFHNFTPIVPNVSLPASDGRKIISLHSQRTGGDIKGAELLPWSKRRIKLALLSLNAVNFSNIFFA